MGEDEFAELLEFAGRDGGEFAGLAFAGFGLPTETPNALAPERRVRLLAHIEASNPLASVQRDATDVLGRPATEIRFIDPGRDYSMFLGDDDTWISMRSIEDGNVALETALVERSWVALDEVPECPATEPLVGPLCGER